MRNIRIYMLYNILLAVTWTNKKAPPLRGKEIVYYEPKTLLNHCCGCIATCEGKQDDFNHLVDDFPPIYFFHCHAIL